MTTNYHTPHQAGDTINDGAVNYNAPLGQLDQAITNMLDGSNIFTGLLIGSGALDASALVEVDATDGGWTFPSMTTAQRNAIANVQGVTVYDDDLDEIFYNDSSAWAELGATAGAGVVNEIDSGTFTGVSSISIASIPSTYSSLKLFLACEPEAGAINDLEMTFNNDVAGNYQGMHIFNVGQNQSFGTNFIRLEMLPNVSGSRVNTRAYYILNFDFYKDTGRYMGVNLQYGLFMTSSSQIRIMRGMWEWVKTPIEAVNEIDIATDTAEDFGGEYILWGVN